MGSTDGHAIIEAGCLLIGWQGEASDVGWVGGQWTPPR